MDHVRNLGSQCFHISGWGRHQKLDANRRCRLSASLIWAALGWHNLHAKIDAEFAGTV
jgi:hypothetical protein